jgi:hypothetical protein
MIAVPTIWLVLPLLVAWVGLTVLALNWLWGRFVEPRVEAHYARKKGWPDDWMRKAKEDRHG